VSKHLLENNPIAPIAVELKTKMIGFRSKQPYYKFAKLNKIQLVKILTTLAQPNNYHYKSLLHKINGARIKEKEL
jgi:hypothetical protein